MSVGGLRYRALLVAFALVLAAPAAAQAVTITFEDLTPHPPPEGTSGLAVNSQYSGQGVTFNNPSALDYGGGFAHSGTVAVEPCVGQEFCASPVRADFTAPQRTVGVWVGHSSNLAIRSASG
jgi:hypothetical protein